MTTTIIIITTTTMATTPVLATTTPTADNTSFNGKRRISLTVIIRTTPKRLASPISIWSRRLLSRALPMRLTRPASCG
jgi:hypothetical protein